MITENPLISVIVPNYNHEHFLKQRLESIFNQTYPTFEVILLDDASTDGSVEILSAYKDHQKVSHFVLNTQNSGSTFKQWEKGIRLAKGEYIWIAESDDYCELNFLETLDKNFKEKRNIGLTYSKSIRVDALGNFIDDLSFWYAEFTPSRWNKGYVNTGKNEIVNYLSIKNTIPNASAVLFKKDLANFSLTDLYDFYLCGDWYFWIKILEKTNLAYSEQKLNFFRTHDNTVRSSKKAIEDYESEKKIMQTYLLKKGLIKKPSATLIAKNKLKRIKERIKRIIHN